jgi:hypothetical protein
MHRHVDAGISKQDADMNRLGGLLLPGLHAFA